MGNRHQSDLIILQTEIKKVAENLEKYCKKYKILHVS
jgi:hypothetical protein